jgi:hypothetical protein
LRFIGIVDDASSYLGLDLDLAILPKNESHNYSSLGSSEAIRKNYILGGLLVITKSDAASTAFPHFTKE